MLKELYTAAMGMMPQQTRLEVAANNMANANATGFKRQAVFERNLIDARANFYNVEGDTEQNDPPIGSYTDFDKGSLQKTDNPLDLAIENNGFFVVQDEEGKQFLTKNGSFKLSEDGSIKSMDGKLLLGQNGPINVFNEFFDTAQNKSSSKSLDIKITPNGEIFANKFSVGTLLIAEPEDAQTLQRVSGSDFVQTNITNSKFLDPENINVKQGYLESSNVDIVSEMVQMIELQRMFEAGSKVIHTNEGTLTNSIRMGRYY